MIIRKANRQDAAQLARMRYLHLKSDEDTYGKNYFSGGDEEAFLKENEEFWEKENGYIPFVAREGEEIVSTIYLYLISWPPMPGGKVQRIGYLSNVFTKENFRGAGIAAKLMEEVKKYAREMNCVRLFVWPSPLAKGWYERQGFGTEIPILDFECEG